MADHTDTEQGPEETFIDASEVEQVIEVDTDGQSQLHGLNDDEDNPADDDAQVGADDDDEMEELPDDSVQGFFMHKEPVYCVAAHPSDPTIFVTGGGDDKAYLWRTYDGEMVLTFAGHTDSVTSVAFNADGQYLATGGMDGKVMVWSLPSGEHAVTLEGPEEIEWIQWHPKGNVLLAGARDNTVWMWMVPSGTCMNVFAGHSGPVTCGRFTHDGKHIVTAAEDGSLIVWDPKTAVALTRLANDDARFHSDMITALAVNSDDTIVATGSADKSVKLIHLHNGNILGSLENSADSIESVDFCTNLPLLAAGSLDGSVGIWDINTFRLRHSLQHEDAVIRAKWLADTTMLITCSADRTTRLWDGLTGQCLQTWRGHMDTVLDMAVSCDSQTVVTVSDDGTALVFRRESSE